MGPARIAAWFVLIANPALVAKNSWLVMQTQIPFSRMMLYQSSGFLAIIALSWFMEFTGLHNLVLGNHPYISDFRESTLEMLLVLAVWLLVMGSTRRILRHARYLQGFMRVCSWCHHVDYKDRWVPLEEFLRKGFDTPTTHSICPKCLARELAAIDGKGATPPKPPEQDRSSLPPEWRQAAKEPLKSQG